MTVTGRVEFQMLGRTLTVRTNESPEYIRSLAAYVEERVTALQASGVRDPMTALSLAVLEITDELFRARENQSKEGRDVTKRIDALLALLENVSPPERT